MRVTNANEQQRTTDEDLVRLRRRLQSDPALRAEVESARATAAASRPDDAGIDAEHLEEFLHGLE